MKNDKQENEEEKNVFVDFTVKIDFTAVKQFD